MRAKIGQVEIEGTANEIAALLKELERSAFNPVASLRPSGLLRTPEQKNDAYISEETAFRLIKRRPLSKEQSATLSTLRKAGSEWVTAKALEAKLGYSSSQLSGMLGAFGKRLTATEGYVKGQWLFDQEWDYENDCNRYRLPDSVSRAAARAGL